MNNPGKKYRNSERMVRNIESHDRLFASMDEMYSSHAIFSGVGLNTQGRNMYSSAISLPLGKNRSSLESIY